MKSDNNISRRDFLHSLLRFALAGLLGGGVGALVLRSGEDCINQGVCRGCPILDVCQLPQARKVRAPLSGG